MAGAFVFAEAAAAAIGVVEGLDTGCDIVGPHATIMLWNVSRAARFALPQPTDLQDERQGIRRMG